MAALIATSPLIYSLVLALLFMRFHHKAEEGPAPYLSEQVKWSMIYKILAAAEIAGATEPTENLVLETFLQLREMALGMQPQMEIARSKLAQQKDQENLDMPAETVSKVLQRVAGARTLQSQLPLTQSIFFSFCRYR